MTSHQFEALKKWIASRTAIAVQLKDRELDKPFVEAKKRELAEIDDAAQQALVDSDGSPQRQQD
jgi:hypothetical protein